MEPVHGLLESLKGKHVLENNHATGPENRGRSEAIDNSPTSLAGADTASPASSVLRHSRSASKQHEATRKPTTFAANTTKGDSFAENKPISRLEQPKKSRGGLTGLPAKAGTISTSQSKSAHLTTKANQQIQRLRNKKTPLLEAAASPLQVLGRSF